VVEAVQHGADGGVHIFGERDALVDAMVLMSIYEPLIATWSPFPMLMGTGSTASKSPLVREPQSASRSWMMVVSIYTVLYCPSLCQI